MTPKEKPIQIKCYCGHTIYCDCSPLVSKQTAVEWLESKLKAVKPSGFCSIEKIIEWTQQSKAMEKEQMLGRRGWRVPARRGVIA